MLRPHSPPTDLARGDRTSPRHSSPAAAAPGCGDVVGRTEPVGDVRNRVVGGKPSRIAADEATVRDCRQLPIAPAPIFLRKPREATPSDAKRATLAQRCGGKVSTARRVDTETGGP